MVERRKPTREEIKEELRMSKDVISTKAKLTRAERAAIWKSKGVSIAEIRSELEFESDEEVSHAINAVLSKQLDNYDRSTLKQEIDQRLELLWRLSYKRALDDKNPHRSVDTKTALSVVDHKRQLHGLDAPKEVKFHNAAYEELQAWVMEVQGQEASGALPVEADILDAEEVDDEDSDEDEHA